MCKRALTAVVVVAGTALMAACATAGAPENGSQRDVLTREQLEAVGYLNAYDAIRRLKPIWLRSERGQDSFVLQGRRGLRVYVDGIPYGDKESLRTLQVHNIEEIEFLDKREATTEFGTDHAEGAVLIRTRHR